MKYIVGYFWTQIQTTIHKYWVSYYLIKYMIKTYPILRYRVKQILKRALVHDLSKYSFAEASGFAKTIFDLKHSTYGSDEYKALLKMIEPSIQHHYKLNRHHPEYHKGGVNDMSFVDTIEMIADWCAAVRRHKNGDIFKSIKLNQKRFNYSDQNRKIFRRIALEMVCNGKFKRITR